MSIFSRVNSRFEELSVGSDDQDVFMKAAFEELSDEEAEIYGRECDLILPMILASDCKMTADEIEEAISEAGIE